MITLAWIAAVVGSTVVVDGRHEVPEPARADAPIFVFGAGDALGVEIRANDAVLAARVRREGAWHAAADNDR